MIARQESFNNELLQALVPMLEQSFQEQRRLRREIEVLRRQLGELAVNDGNNRSEGDRLATQGLSSTDNTGTT